VPIAIISPKIAYTLGFVQRGEPVFVQTFGPELKNFYGSRKRGIPKDFMGLYDLPPQKRA
jgi:hypothetical protein